MPFEATGWYWEEFPVGHVMESEERLVSEQDVADFARLSEDTNPLHTSEEYAKQSPFGRRIAHGMLILAATTGLTCRTGKFVGTTIAFMSLTAKFLSPIYFGDRIKCRMKVKEKKESREPDRGVVIFDVRVRNQDDRLVAQTEWVLLMKRKENAVKSQPPTPNSQ
jgi:acyl dehydratase